MYAGLTAYFFDTPETLENIGTLANAISELKPFCAQENVNIDKALKNADPLLKQSEEFNVLKDQDQDRCKDAWSFSNDTPDDYRHVVIEPVRVKNVDLLRLYVPGIATGKPDVKYLIEFALCQTIISLFKSSTVTIKTRLVRDDQHFKDAKETIWLHAPKELMAQAG